MSAKSRRRKGTRVPLLGPGSAGDLDSASNRCCPSSRLRDQVLPRCPAPQTPYTDHDLYLSPEITKTSASPHIDSHIYNFLTGITPPVDFEEDVAHDPNGETLTLEAQMQPLLMDSMTKSKDGFLGVSHSSLSGLRSWKSPAVPASSFSASQFRAFLPPKNKDEVGDTWWVIPSELNIFTGYLPNNRYHPPSPKGKEVLIHSLLSMFHPRPFIKSRFAPQGAVACIRASNNFYYDIVFRIHAEFQLNDVPDFPFWFTPGKFIGNIVLSKDASHVRHFHLYVPNDRSLNVDMEWLYGASESSNMEVDIGYLPQLELQATGPSTPSSWIRRVTSSTAKMETASRSSSSLRTSTGPRRSVRRKPLDGWRSPSTPSRSFYIVTIVLPPRCPTCPSQKPLSERQQRINWCTPFCFGEHWTISSGRTLRETVLESSPVMALLNQSFISSWSLVRELENMQADEQNPVLSEKAKLHLENYNFPVEMMVALPNGTIIHHINANFFLDQTAMKPEEEEATFSFSAAFEDPSTATYLSFLKEGLEKAKQYLAQ
ncbi:hypothetical protein F7725_008111 [Dissostichus mawsoni]|uniref:Selenoprotein N n=1 Tax=Dissostichus mawsoni TaxID=36200 RepID=A0A7J5Y9A6_DISMA|nr:hypothetical protein F7725_008111 [Dissostichus mawsoni]